MRSGMGDAVFAPLYTVMQRNDPQSVSGDTPRVHFHFLHQLNKITFVKDEAGHTLSRISEYRRVAPDLLVFTGAHGKTMIDELERGSSGSMPAAPFFDLYVQLWNYWQAGKREKAMEDLSRISLLVNQVSAYGLP